MPQPNATTSGFNATGSILVAVVSHEKKNSQGKVGARTVPAVPPAGWPRDCHGLLERWRLYGVPPHLIAMASPGRGLSVQLGRFRRAAARSTEAVGESHGKGGCIGSGGM